VVNNLAWMDELAETHRAPLDTVLEGPDGYKPDHIVVSVWQQTYLAWAIDHARQQGYPGGLKLRDRMVRFRLKLFTSGKDFPREFAGIAWPTVGLKTGSGKIDYITSFAGLFKENCPPGSKPDQFAGLYGVDARLALMLAIQNGWPGAREAYRFVYTKIAVEPYLSGVSDLAHRAGWAIALEGEK
jgi:hypothetical protein